MSGIAGLYFTNQKPVQQREMERMLAAIKHRGPHHAGTWAEGSIGLAGRTLFTTPESLHEQPPLYDAERNLAITADARLHNRGDLLAALGLSAVNVSEISDSRLILRAYEKWGEGCPEKLLGDFAFGLWDGRQQRLFCARDPSGVCPFYYSQHGGMFAFASEIKALLTLPEIPRRLNEARLLEYLAINFDTETHTFYEGIQILPAAHQMSVGVNGLSLRRYWSLEPARELRLGSDAEYAEAFRDIFREAVRCRVHSAGPVGSTLSGGLDSSSIACLAAQFARQSGTGPLPTFSVIFDDVPQSDERDYMNAALAQGGMEPHFIHGDKIGPFFDIERVLRQEDEPFHAGNLFLHWAMYEAAAAAGVSVLLDGLDGDTTVSHGAYRLVELARAGRWPSVLRETHLLGERHSVPARGILRGNVISPLVPPGLRNLWRTVRRRNSPVDSLDVALNPDFATRAHFHECAPALLGLGTDTPRTEREHHFQRLTRGIMPYVLGVADRASAAFSLEARYPFFDRRLIEFCLSLPADQKLRDGWSRWVMRGAMQDILPAEIQWRGGKSNLEPNLLHTLHTHDLGRLRQILAEDGDRIAPYVAVAPLRAGLEEFAAHKKWVTVAPIMRTALLALWLRQAEL